MSQASMFAVPYATTVKPWSRTKGATIVVTVCGVEVDLFDEESEYRAAQKAGARFDLPNHMLLALAKKSKIPAEWLNTPEEKPF
jgi:hypothetical protein